MIWLLSGCVTQKQNPILSATAEPDQEIVWPARPEQARIRYLYFFDRPADIGYSLPFTSRLLNFFSGTEEYGMIRPYAIDVNEQFIAVADPGAASVHLFNRKQKIYLNFSDVGQQSLHSPVGIALGEDRIYVADSVLNKVFVLDRRQRLIAVLRNFERPTSLAVDHVSQRLYVADTLSHKIMVFDHEGQKVLSIGERGFGSGQFNFPSHISIAGNRLYVNDTLNFRVQVFDLDGNHIQTFGEHGDSLGYMERPKGLAVNSDGHIFVAEAVANRVQIFNLDGDFLLDFGFSGKQPAAFRMPAGIAIAHDRIYVVDSRNRRIQVFEYLGDD